MKEQLISFETAKLAKQLGFNHIKPNCFGDNMAYELPEGQLKYTHYSNVTKGYILAPTQSLLQKWLREKGYFCRIYFGGFNQYKGLKGIMYSFEYNFAHCANEDWIQHLLLHDTYEEALESGLLNGLKWIKKNETE